jgi:hypothetical protein
MDSLNADVVRRSRGERLRLGIGEPPMRPATNLAVTSCADDGSAGTLRYVLAGAVAGDVIDLSGLACSTITLAQGDLVAMAAVTLQGPGRDALTIDADGQSDVLISNYNLEIDDLSIANGYQTDTWGGCLRTFGAMTLNRVALTNCTAHEATTYHGASLGGAVFAWGALDVADSIISGNTNSSAVTLGLPYDGEVAGGALMTMVGDITVTGSTLSDNHVIATPTTEGPTVAHGGAVASKGGAITVSDSIVSDNDVSNANVYAGPSGVCRFAQGGGISAGHALTLERTTVSGNSVSAPDTDTSDVCAGGVYVSVNLFRADESTISGNTTDGTVGGIHANGGFAIYNTTISGNSAAAGAGGLFAVSTGQSILSGTTIAFNSSEFGGGGAHFFNDTLLHSSIIANNTSMNGLAEISVSNGTIAGDHNLVMDAGDVALPADTLSDDPLLQPLADNGGPTMTHALGEGSPAIDAGSNDDALAYDQRGPGFFRVSGLAADIGAFEVQVPQPDPIFRNGFDGK